MDHYHVWLDLKPGVNDLEFCREVVRYLGHLQERELVASFRIARKKLGLASAPLPEFHVWMEVRDLAQLERAFQVVAARSGEPEGLHAAVNQKVRNAVFALYRDFPDAARVEGDERF